MTEFQQRRLLRISGADARSFLQGLITNDVNKLDQGLVYTALLTPQGKYMADFFLVPDGESILLDTDAAQTDMLAKRLTMYKLRADVSIEEDERSVTRGTSETPEGAFADPRSNALGWRSYAGHADENVDWSALYVAHSVPNAGRELSADSFILEMGFERLNGVDFKKGCYVGQEITARMKHKTELRKGLAQVSITGEAPIGTDITTADGKPAGTLFSQSNGHALAYLRFDRATGALNAKDAQITYAP
ncbi:folate-binding protein [Planktotalea sp.]|uniref:CAF17-like 4Fe-4S cluster assembly/insertion protein YgfZ n=1 Tax=Planktotalea sp. TaxID=2029877 RepID=UPI00329762DA